MRNYFLLGIVFWTGMTLACRKAGPSAAGGDVAARVNGKDILRADVEKHLKVRMQGAPQNVPEDAVNSLKLEILRDLIEGEIMTQKAGQLKLVASDAEIDAEFKKLKGGSTDEEFKKTLTERGVSEIDLRQEIRRSLSLEKVVKDQVQSKVRVSDAEITKFFAGNREIFNIKERQYRIGQIVVTPNPQMPVNNLRNDKALTEEDALRKIEMLTGRLQAGDDFAQLAREYSEDSETAQRGGDLGYQPVSSLDRYSPALKTQLAKMKVGEVAPVVRAADTYIILKLAGKREPGQRDLGDPEVKQSIREELQNQRQQLLTAAFSEQIHNDARVENFLAGEILAGIQKGE